MARGVFGSEPSDPERFGFIMENYTQLSFSQPLTDTTYELAQPMNFKRRQREAKAMMTTPMVTTKAQEALRLKLERYKQTRQEMSNEARDELARQTFLLKQQQKKEKHRGH